MELRQLGPHRRPGQPALPRRDDVRPLGQRGPHRLDPHHPPRARRGHQLRRHRRRLLGRCVRGDRRRGPQGPPRRRLPRDQVLHADEPGRPEHAAGRKHPDRVWAVEGCNGIGKHIAHRLVHDGETVVDVPPKLSAQVRVFATGNGRKADPVDAHSVAMVALRSPNLVQVHVDPELVVMGKLVDRRDELGRARTQTINRLHRAVGAFPGRGRAVPVPPPDDQAARPRREDPAAARGRAGR